jgi:hypothetical protein
VACARGWSGNNNGKREEQNGGWCSIETQQKALSCLQNALVK